MTDNSKDSGPEAGAKGVVEGVKGKVKEAAGVVAGKDDLRREGRARQERADSQREVAAKEAEGEGPVQRQTPMKLSSAVIRTAWALGGGQRTPNSKS